MKTPVSSPVAQGFIANERWVLNFGRVLLVGMAACLAVGMQHVGERLFTGWQGSYLPWMAALVALEAVVSAGQTRRTHNLDLSLTLYRLVEWVVILALVKIYFYVRDGWDHLWGSIRNPGPELLDQLLNPEFVLIALALLLLWFFVSWTMHDLYEIESALDLLDSSGYEKYYSNTSTIRNAIAQRLSIIGLLLVLASGVAHADWELLMAGKFSVPQVENWYVLAYFILMILVLGQTYFSTLRAGWAWERIQIERRIAAVWLAYALLALLLIGFVISLLPTRYSLGFLETLQWVLGIVLGIVFSVFFYIAMFVAYVFAWVYSFFLGSAPPDELPEIEEFVPPEMPDGAIQTATGAEIVQSLAFWIFLVLLVIFAFYQYLRQNRTLLHPLRQFSLWQGLAKLIAWMRGWFQGAGRQMSQALQQGLERLRTPRGADAHQQSANFLNPNRLSPRNRVIFFYLALIRRGAQAGIPRKVGETPQEYAQTLQAHFEHLEQPADPASLSELTQSFQEARYSRHEITASQANRVRSAWMRLRQILRGRK